MHAPELVITVNEYRDRRERVLAALESASAVVFAGNEVPSDSLQWRWTTDRHFW